MITMALVLGIGAWVTVRALAAGLRSDLGDQNEEVLDRLADEIAGGADVRSLLLPFGADGTDFLILDDRGQVINASLVPGPDGLPIGMFGSQVIAFEAEFSPEEAALIEEQFGIVFTDVTPGSFEEAMDESLFVDADGWFESTREVASPNDGQLTLIATSPVGILDRSITRLSIALSIIVPILVALGGWALWAATGAALRPVRDISEEANRIAPSNSGARLPVPETGDEIAQLTRTLNGMLDRLDDGLIRQRQFISDASHELRSPLTTITGAAELVGSRDDLPADAEPTVALLQRGVARLEAVLDDVTQLAEGDGGRPTVEVDLDAVLAREIASVAREIPDADFDRARIEPMVIKAHETQLSRAIQNLLANAGRHAESTVAVSARRTAENEGSALVEIVVEDDGPGVPPADRERIFDRFVRLDDGRSRASGGSGLGLAIVAAIAKAHGGSVRCEESPLGGARFVLTIQAGN